MIYYRKHCVAKVVTLLFVLLIRMSGFAAGIVSHYPFDGTLEDIVGPHDGTFMPGSSPNYVASPFGFGQALLLDGSHYVDIGFGQPKGEIMRNGSVTLWFNKASTPDQHKLFFGTMNNGVSTGIWAGLLNGSDFIELGIRNDMGGNISWAAINQSTISPDTWYFYAATWKIMVFV